MTRTVDSRAASLLLRAQAIHPFDGTSHTCREIAIKGNTIVALGQTPGSLDALIGPQTRVIETGGAITPGFYDTHVHHFEGAMELPNVQVQQAQSISDLTAAIGSAARDRPAGEWIVTTRNWHESALQEQRLPTAAELDLATDAHPVCLRRGSHLLVANTLALQAAGLPPSDGQLVGDESIAPVLRVLPALSFEEQVAALAQMNRVFNQHGIVAIRDPGIGTDSFRVYQAAWERGTLSVRCTVMLRLDEGWSLERIRSEIDRWGVRTGFGDEMLRIGGVKLFADGRIEDAALSVPESDGGAFTGVLHLPRPVMEEAVRHAVARGWEVGCHAVGDAALQTVLESYEAVLRDFPALPPGALVVEHALLAPPMLQRRAAKLRVGISIHPPLMFAFGAEMVRFWGERADEANPVREWLEEKALLAAGSDGCVPPFDPLLAIWNLVTRATRAAGVLGRDHAVSIRDAFHLYTVAGARVFREEAWRGALQPGLRADLVAFDRDPLRADADELPEIGIDLTLVDGDVVHDRLGYASQVKT